MNQVALTGRLVDKATITKAPTQDKRGLFAATIAVDGGKNPKGEEITYFFDLYGNYSSEKWLSYLTKGLKVAVSGTLFYLDKTGKDGKKYRNFYIRALSIDFILPEKPVETAPASKAEEKKSEELVTEDMPF